MSKRNSRKNTRRKTIRNSKISRKNSRRNSKISRKNSRRKTRRSMRGGGTPEKIIEPWESWYRSTTDDPQWRGHPKLYEVFIVLDGLPDDWENLINLNPEDVLTYYNPFKKEKDKTTYHSVKEIPWEGDALWNLSLFETRGRNKLVIKFYIEPKNVVLVNEEPYYLKVGINTEHKWSDAINWGTGEFSVPKWKPDPYR